MTSNSLPPQGVLIILLVAVVAIAGYTIGKFEDELAPTPNGHVQGAAPWLVTPIESRSRELPNVVMYWSPGPKTCYLSVPGWRADVQIAYVDVPSSWCEGLR